MLPVKSIMNRFASGDSALSRATRRFQEASAPARIGFVIDATGSRANTWEDAQAAQRRIFEATARVRRLAVRLIHFGGTERSDHGWNTDASGLAAAMAGVRCVRGLTQILPSLLTFLEGDPKERPQAVIVVGDCFEEDVACVSAVAGAFKAAGIRIYAFHEGDDALAGSVFRQLADGTGGRFLRFGEDLPLADLCEAVAVLTAGGEKAVKRLTNNRAAVLLLAPPADNAGRSR